MKLNKTYTFDFECTSREPAEVYMCSICRLDKTDYNKVITFLTIEDTIKYIFSRKDKSIFYAHNLKYDISFILAYLFKNYDDEFYISHQIISPLTKAFFEIKIIYNDNEICFRDSLCLFNAPLSKVLESYTDLEKTETPIFDYKKDVRIDSYVLKYSKIDALGLALALKERLKFGNNALTTASGAYKEFKKITVDRFGLTNYNNFYPILDYEVQREMRKAYRGGFTFLNELYQNIIIENVKQIDVNSMYPAQLYFNYMPVGEPKIIEGEVKADSLYNLGIQKIILNNASVKNDKIPFLSNTNTFLATNVYRDVISEHEEEEDRTFYLTLQELELFKESYNYDKIKYCGGYLFKSRKDMFVQYIDKFWEMKSNKNPTIKSLGKLFLNSLYGKFAEGYEKDNLDISYNNKLTFTLTDTTIREVGYLPVGIFTTSYARCFLIKSIYNIGVENFIYCDTDSIHYINDPNLEKLEFHESELGKWGYKDTYIRAFYIRAKRYCGEVIKNGEKKLEIACAGIKKKDINEQVKKLEDFKIGKEIKTLEFKQGINGQYVRDKIIKI